MFTGMSGERTPLACWRSRPRIRELSSINARFHALVSIPRSKEGQLSLGVAGAGNDPWLGAQSGHNAL